MGHSSLYFSPSFTGNIRGIALLGCRGRSVIAPITDLPRQPNICSWSGCLADLHLASYNAFYSGMFDTACDPKGVFLYVSVLPLATCLELSSSSSSSDEEDEPDVVLLEGFGLLTGWAVVRSTRIFRSSMHLSSLRSNNCIWNIWQRTDNFY